MASEVYPYKKKGGREFLLMLKDGRHKKIWGSFSMGA